MKTKITLDRHDDDDDEDIDDTIKWHIVVLPQCTDCVSPHCVNHFRCAERSTRTIVVNGSFAHRTKLGKQLLQQSDWLNYTHVTVPAIYNQLKCNRITAICNGMHMEQNAANLHSLLTFWTPNLGLRHHNLLAVQFSVVLTRE